MEAVPEQAIVALEAKIRELRKLLTQYETVLADLKAQRTTPEDAADERIPRELVSLLRNRDLSIARSAFAVVYFLGPCTLDRIYRLLVRYRRLREKAKDQLRAAIQGTARECLVVDPHTKLYDFASREAREWFVEILEPLRESAQNMTHELGLVRERELLDEGGTMPEK